MQRFNEQLDQIKEDHILFLHQLWQRQQNGWRPDLTPATFPELLTPSRHRNPPQNVN